MKTIERTELIDRYLLGEATAEEKMQVERLLSDPELSLEDRDKFRKEMELQQEIILAIQKQGLKEILQQADEKDAKEEEHNRKVRIWTIRSVASLAIAACFVGVILVGPQMSRLRDLGQQDLFFTEAYMDMNNAYAGSCRGESETADAIIEANALMQAGNYKQADDLLAAAIKSMPDVDKGTQSWDEKEDMLYLQALCAIKQHKLYRSRRLLNELVDMDTTHKNEAQRLLNTIKHGK